MLYNFCRILSILLDLLKMLLFLPQNYFKIDKENKKAYYWPKILFISVISNNENVAIHLLNEIEIRDSFLTLTQIIQSRMMTCNGSKVIHKLFDRRRGFVINLTSFTCLFLYPTLFIFFSDRLIHWLSLS